MAKQLADCVIPNEYGIDPAGKMRIGSKICCALLGKLLADLANMREESIATAVRTCTTPHCSRLMSLFHFGTAAHEGEICAQLESDYLTSSHFTKALYRWEVLGRSIGTTGGLQE